MISRTVQEFTQKHPHPQTENNPPRYAIVEWVVNSAVHTAFAVAAIVAATVAAIVLEQRMASGINFYSQLYDINSIC